jgi:hypothetical protein
MHRRGRRNNFHRSARWPECVAEAGLPEGFRFHDLCHIGNTLAASSGASTRELMRRMRHPNRSKRALAGTGNAVAVGHVFGIPYSVSPMCTPP